MASVMKTQTQSAGRSPVVDLVNAAKPMLMMAIDAADAAGPIVYAVWSHVYRLWIALQPYHPEDWLPCVFGLMLIFFGGQFPTVIAAVEAFRICGWARTRQSLTIVYRQCEIALQASRKDDTIDANGDGIVDVKQMSKNQLLSHKMALFLRCTDPNALNEAFLGLTAGCSAVVATLRLQFAETITLGVALGDIFKRAADRILQPELERVVSKEYHKWIGVIIDYLCRSVAVTIAWFCQRVISALHSATRGAQLVLFGIEALALRHHIQLPIELSNTSALYPIICGTLATVGFYSQLSRGFALPFPLNFLLFPVKIVEWFLYFFVTY